MTLTRQQAVAALLFAVAERTECCETRRRTTPRRLKPVGRPPVTDEGTAAPTLDTVRFKTLPADDRKPTE